MLTRVVQQTTMSLCIGLDRFRFSRSFIKLIYTFCLVFSVEIVYLTICLVCFLLS